jgi:hypothetical protein
MMVSPDVQMLDVLHGDRFRRLSPKSWSNHGSSGGFGRRSRSRHAR